MLIHMRTGEYLENAQLLFAEPGNGGLAFLVQGDYSTEGVAVVTKEWIDQDCILNIYFDRDTAS